MAWEIQLAFQGGGSRFMQHLAVASAFQKLEAARLIKINNVAGTSAGSLAAAIVAAGIKAEDAGRIIAENKRRYLAKLKIPNRLTIATRFVRGEPLLNISALEEILRDVWARAGAASIKTFSDLQKPLIVMATDIVTRKPQTFQAPQDEIIPALLNSCALPIIYRSLNHIAYQQNLVDGALVENLPLTKLIERKHSDGHVVAVTFAQPESYKRPENQIQYIATLVNIAISHSVEQIKRLVDRRHIFEIHSNLEPLDFRSAIEEFGYGTDNFAELKQKAETWIKNNAISFDQTRHAENTIPVDPDQYGLRTMEYIQQIFSMQHKDAKYTIKKRAIVVTAFSILKSLFPTDPRANQRDEINQFYFVQPDVDPLYCMPIRLDISTQNLSGLTRSLTVTTRDGSPLKPIIIPLTHSDNPAEGTQIAQALIFFTPVLRREHAEMFPVKVRSFALIDGAMENLASGNQDFISIFNSANSDIEVAELVLAVPDKTPHIEVSWRVDENPDVFVRGSAMSPAELNSNFHDLIPGDFRLLGWSAPNLKRKQRLFVRLTLGKKGDKSLADH